MTDVTALDQAHGAMEAAPEDDTARLRFYDQLAQSELFLMLAKDADGGDQITPEIFEVGADQYVLVFDREARLTGFAGRAVPYVALSGRAIASMLAGQRIGLGVNLEVAPSAILLPATAVTWLNETLGHSPDEVEAAVTQVHPPSGLPEALITALDGKLATAMGLAQSAYLVGVTYDTGARGHLLAFVGAVPEAQDALARAAAEALTFSGIEAGAMDVGFFPGGEPVVGRMEAVGLRFDLPQPQEPTRGAVIMPGRDPDKPPRLR
ncbi:SseB family protein [Roseobacter sinensis]|uniref:SseB family protein n=1 Tax=Roseobacter sinensis TaxID=2931391 RepID=A0ABT3BFB0_9RHOB|nr:SseB family protein [Roseobacter sp. WL0113]MCV3272248.1 SseB family protein [Roseobacter sp. WL0113]